MCEGGFVKRSRADLLVRSLVTMARPLAFYNKRFLVIWSDRSRLLGSVDFELPLDLVSKAR